MRLALEPIACDGAAFEDDPGAELARILRELAAELDTAGTPDDGRGGALYDLNGNRVGGWRFHR